MALVDATDLTPAQAAVLDALRVGSEGRPTFAPQLGGELRSELEARLAPAIPAMDAIGVDKLWISKHKVASVLGCERRFLAELDDSFGGWTVARARGTVAHRAIELSMHVHGAPVPNQLVDHALVAL